MSFGDEYNALTIILEGLQFKLSGRIDTSYIFSSVIVITRVFVRKEEDTGRWFLAWESDDIEYPINPTNAINVVATLHRAAPFYSNTLDYYNRAICAENKLKNAQRLLRRLNTYIKKLTSAK